MENNIRYECFSCNPGRIITNSPFRLPSSISRYLTVLQRVQIRDGRSVLSCGSGREFEPSFSISLGIPPAHSYWGYIVGDDLQSPWLLAGLAMLPFTNPRPSSCHIWWLYPLCLRRCHSWYMTCTTVCCILSISYRWQWTVRRTKYLFCNENLPCQKG